jgi:hypothetical protein
MEDLLRILQTFEVWIYALLGVVGLITLRRVLQFWQEYRSAVFGLERESAQRRFNAALSALILVGLFGVAEFVLVSFVSPNVAGMPSLATPTMELLESTPAVQAEATSTVEPSLETGPTLAPVISSGCISGQIEWVYPKDQDEVKGIIEPQGTVNVPNLGFYKYEYSPIDQEQWITIAAGNAPKVEAPLGGNWNTSQLVPGDYKLRLVVTDNQNGVFPACAIAVRILGE